MTAIFCGRSGCHTSRLTSLEQRPVFRATKGSRMPPHFHRLRAIGKGPTW